MVERMLRSAVAVRALFVPGVMTLGLSACAPETSSDIGASAGSSATQTGSSQIGVAGTSSGAAGQSPTLGAAGRSATVGGGGAGSPAAGAASPSTMVGVAGRAAIGGSSATGAGGALAVAGRSAAGMSGGAAGMSAAAGTGSSDTGNGSGETGRMVGITEAHNVVRARLMNPKPEPALPPLKWSTEIAKVAQAYAEKLASGGNCLNLVHSQAPGYGENLAGYQGTMVKPADVVEGWAAEEECYKFGPISRSGEDCDSACAMEKHSNGCGHYTQVVWRGTTEVGCGMATCGSGRSGGEVWVCNYKAPGNFIGMEPY